MTDLATNPRQTMWQMLADTIVENIGNFHLDRILGMVKKNLTFDDPGLFSTKILETDVERDLERASNTWLVNQLVYSLSVCKNVKSNQTNIALQREILSASIAKQSWFFKDLVHQYLDYTRLLLSADVGSEIGGFFVEGYPMNNISSSCVFQKIKMQNEAKRQDLLVYSIRILIHAMVIGRGLYKGLFSHCTDCVLEVYNSSTMPARLVCIEYMVKTLYNADAFDHDLLKGMQLVLQGSWTICEKIPIWLETNDVSKPQIVSFLSNLDQLFKALRPIKLNTDNSEQFEDIIRMHVRHLLNSSNSKFQSLDISYHKIQSVILKNLTILLARADTMTESSEIRDLEQSILFIPECIKVLEINIMQDLKRVNDSVDVYKLSSTWKALYRYYTDSFQFVNVNFSNASDELTTHLKTIVEITKSINTIQHNYNLQHQISHISSESQCKLCELALNKATDYNCLQKYILKVAELNFFPDGNMLASLRKFVDVLMKISTVGIDDYCLLCDLATALLNNKLVSNFSSSEQVRLIDVIAQSIKTRYNLNLRSSAFNITEVSESEEELQLKSVSLLFTLDIKHLTLDATEYLKGSIKKICLKVVSSESGTQFETILVTSLVHIAIRKILPVQFIFEDVTKRLIDKNCTSVEFFAAFKCLMCLLSSQTNVLCKIEGNYFKYTTICYNCDSLKKCLCQGVDQEKENHLGMLKETQSISIPRITNNYILNKPDFQKIFTWLKSSESVPVALVNFLPSYLAHLNYNSAWIQLFSTKDAHLRLVFSSQITGIMHIVLKAGPDVYEAILEDCIRSLLEAVKESLVVSDLQRQSGVINMITKFALVDGLPQKTLLQLFRMTFMFFIRKESCVAYEAALCAQEMCARNEITPRNLLNWYKREVLSLIISLCVSIFMRNGIGLNKALSTITKMLGFGGPRDFIAKNYKLMIAMLLSWCIKYPKCERLIEEIAIILQKDLSACLTSSFLTVYPYLFLNETSEVNNQCIEFVIRRTESSLYKLLHSDIKRTVAEILIYYHKNPTNVMNAFRCLILNIEGTNTIEMSHSKVAEYIVTRFLGVLTFFESCLLDPDFEKNLKEETLLSFGEIMRFIGSTHITPFRFKILAMLRTTLMIEDTNLRAICVGIWNIFVHTIDVQALGPLLGTIVASLEPLLKDHSQEVNLIYRYLIVSNGSLLSLYIPELYFIENMNVSNEIKEFVRHQTEKRRGKNFMDKFEFFLKQIGHENPTVRVYGLNYLTKLFEENRSSLNNLITNALTENTILDGLLQNLIVGCCHNDVNLQLASGKCLGELGAVEPSHLAPNYAPQKNFALSIHTDSFAIMALEELCRAYQFQKDTKYVDSFSLAIQEILVTRGVCPKLKKKMEVWEAIPERMRQLMEPLLTSCYTGLKMTTNIKTHPIFGSAKCQTAEEWAFIWASKMIEKVKDAESSHLLNSFKPSIKRDASTLGLFLPYIFLHTLQTCDPETCEHIYEELQCVLAAAESQQNVSISDFKNTRQRGLKSLQFFPSKTIGRADDRAENIGIKCAKMAFEQLDFLERWLREWRRVYLGHTPDSNFIAVDSFVNRFEKKLIARANFNCGEYARALMYLEAYIEENPTNLLQENLSFLAAIYAELMNPDSLEGAIGLKKTDMSLSEQILVNNMADRFMESTACFEQLMQYEDVQPNQVSDIVQCYLRLDTPETALLVSEGLLNQVGEKYLDNRLRSIQAEPLWRLGRFEDLEELLEVPEISECNSWGVKCGQALLCYRKTNIKVFDEKIKDIRLSALNMLKSSGVEQDSYHKGYHHIMILHLVSEIEEAKNLTRKLHTGPSQAECQPLLENFFKNWNHRLALLQPIPRITEPVLCLRRILLSEMVNLLKHTSSISSKMKSVFDVIDDEIARMWLQSSELARTAGLFQQAQLCIMNAQKYNPSNLFIEKAKLLWKKGDQTNCFKILEQKIDEIVQSAGPSKAIQNLPKTTRLLYAEAKFLQATYNAESMNISTDMNLRYFKEAIIGNPRSEKSLVYLAQYLDRMFASMSETEQENAQGREVLLDIMRYYGKSMSYGCEFIYQSMPRMLSVWLDFTSQTKRDDHFRRVALKMNDIVEKLSDELPLFAFFTAFSQMVSRICHPSAETYAVLKTIIVKLIQKFPQQSIWLILSVFKSSYTGRVKRCTEIFSDQRLSAKTMQKLITDLNSLAEKLIELTNKEIPKTEKHPRVSSLVRHLPKLFSTPDFSRIIMPFQEFTQPVLPPINERCNPASSFDAFPYKCVYMAGIKEEIVILMSLQRPRKVVLLGSDGKEYILMLKPKDDLRKDFRLMEFNAVVKQYLHQDPDARHRRLGIRTYAVLPLNEECGLIEWVPNLQAFRQILLGFYKQRSLGMNAKELKNASCKIDDPVEKKREVFLKTLLPRHPPVFAEWFRYRFTTPHNWYQARSSYVRTLAVMSIVGYILGLGDRHGENILFDSTNGDSVHVDFNCLFNKGETFDYPEKVPFRLTHNMVHAMGPLGTEGLYRKCCEITMRVLRAQTPTFMSVLRPFVYDPLVSWSRNKTDGNAERTDQQAMANIKRIEERLKGYVRIKGRTTNMPLSVEGHVNFVIEEATDIDNLAAMYIGWGSYM